MRLFIEVLGLPIAFACLWVLAHAGYPGIASWLVAALLLYLFLDDGPPAK